MGRAFSYAEKSHRAGPGKKQKQYQPEKGRQIQPALKENQRPEKIHRQLEGVKRKGPPFSRQ